MDSFILLVLFCNAIRHGLISGFMVGYIALSKTNIIFKETVSKRREYVAGRAALFTISEILLEENAKYLIVGGGLYYYI